MVATPRQQVGTLVSVRFRSPSATTISLTANITLFRLETDMTEV